MHRSTSLDSLSLQILSANSVLTSTANPEDKLVSKLRRRMEIIPTPNKPERLLKSNKHQSTIHEDNLIQTSTVDSNVRAHILDNDYILTSKDQHSLENLRASPPDHYHATPLKKIKFRFFELIR